MTRSFRNLKTFLFCFVCHVVRANKSETDLKESSCWVSASRVRFKEDFDALLRCWRWCSIETDSVIDQFGAAAYAWSFSETRSNHLFSHALTLRFLLIFQTHETATFFHSDVHFCVYGGLFIQNWTSLPFMEAVCLCWTFFISHSIISWEKIAASSILLCSRMSIR